LKRNNCSREKKPGSAPNTAGDGAIRAPKSGILLLNQVGYCTFAGSKTKTVNMNNYETVFILNPVLSDDQAKDTVEKFVNVLTKAKAQILNNEQWGLKKLAYPINKKSTGFYNLIEFAAESPVIDALETEYRRDESVMRFLTTVLDKHAVVYNERRRKGAFNKENKKPTKKAEEGSGR
jgi:small subunit ribosomal protein S6